MKASITPYIRLARLDRPIGIWLLLLPGWWSILLASGGFARMNMRDWELCALFGLGAVLMRSAGCVINDLWDRDLDRAVARTKSRPLAMGEINSGGALVFLGALLALSALILWQMNVVTILLGVLSLAFIIVYPLMKRITWWPQAFLGLTFNFGALMGWAAVTATVQMPALLLYAGGFFWTLAYDTIYARQDAEDDALAGIKSSALRLGTQVRPAAAGFLIAALLLVFTACFYLRPGVMPMLCLLPAALHALWQIRSWRPEDTASSLKIFRSNRDFGLLVLIGIGALFLI